MKAFVRGAAVLITTAATLFGAAASAQDKTVLTTERDKVSYMVGIDIAQSIAPVAPDIDLAAFERAIKQRLRRRQAAAQRGRGAGRRPGADAAHRLARRPGAGRRQGARRGQGQGRPTWSAPMSAARWRRSRTSSTCRWWCRRSAPCFNKGTPLLSEAEQARGAPGLPAEGAGEDAGAGIGAGRQEQGRRRRVPRQEQGGQGRVHHGSGLQYMVLRQGAGARPKPTDRSA